MWLELFSWVAVAIYIPALIGLAVGVMSMSPPEYFIAKICFTASAVILICKVSWWLGFEQSPQTISDKIVAFVIFGLIGTSWLLSVQWINSKEQKPLASADANRALNIVFDEKRHKKSEANGQCCWFYIDVENKSKPTVQNVTVKIVDLKADNDQSNEVISSVIGHTLALAETADGPYTPPKASTVIHAGDRATFEIVRICQRPGNHWITHSNYIQSVINPQTHRQMWQQKPNAVIPPGKYSITLLPQGDNASGKLVTFEFWATEDAVYFREI